MHTTQTPAPFAALEFAEPDGELWAQYDTLATRCFGHRVSDLVSLRDVAQARVATRAGRVVAGGLGLLVPQHFGGRPVPGVCLGAGCVAPEARGARVAETLMAERIQAARDRGAVLASMWTSSTGYVRHLGWEAIAPVFAWEAPIDDLRAFPAGDLDVRYGETPEGRLLQRELARQWNGPVERPTWWSTWKQRKGDLLTYEFIGPGRRPAGVLSFAMVARRPRGHDLVVHDLWAADLDAARAMLSFLGRYHSRAQTVQFRRAALAPYPVLLQGLRSFRLSAQAWHPWMLRVLDAPRALRLRGWPEHAAFEIALGIEGEPRALLLSVEHGDAHARPTDAEPTAVFPPGQFAVWYAGGIASPVSARMSGVTGEPGDLARLVDATRAQEPWLPDLF